MVTMYTYDDGTGRSGTFLNSSLSIQVLDSFQVCRRLNDMNILGSPFKLLKINIQYINGNWRKKDDFFFGYYSKIWFLRIHYPGPFNEYKMMMSG